MLEIEDSALVPGDVLLLSEGGRLSADARVVRGSVELNRSPLTGESQPVSRSAERHRVAVSLLAAEDLVFSGTLVTAGRPSRSFTRCWDATREDRRANPAHKG